MNRIDVEKLHNAVICVETLKYYVWALYSIRFLNRNFLYNYPILFQKMASFPFVAGLIVLVQPSAFG